VNRRTQRPLVALAVAGQAAVLVLVACGNPNSPQAQPNPTFSAEVSETPGLSPMPGMSAMPSARPAPGVESANTPAPVGPNAVSIDGFAFVPAILTVKAGTAVTWTNKDEEPHTVVADGGAFRSEALGSGGTFTFTFSMAGTIDYVCSIHPFMHGSVVVTP
jgi:plastocyanin